MEMNCKKALRAMNAYLDGELSHSAGIELERHIKGCQGCRDRLEILRQVETLLDDWVAPPLPQGFAVWVSAAAQERLALKKGRRGSPASNWLPFRWLAERSVPIRIAACGVALLACLLGLFLSKDLSLSLDRRTAAAGGESIEGFEWFSPTPPASVGYAYVTATVTARETGGRPK
jgi:anti-sigma factor RsiW